MKFFILLNFIDFLEMGHLRFGTSQPGLIKVAGLKQIRIVKLVKQSHLANLDAFSKKKKKLTWM